MLKLLKLLKFLIGLVSLKLLEGCALRKVFYGKFESWYRCREIFISVHSSNPKLGLFKPSLNTDVRKKNGITQ